MTQNGFLFLYSLFRRLVIKYRLSYHKGEKKMAKEKEIFAALEPLGFETAGGVCLGTWKGYAVDLRPNGGTYYIDVAARFDKADKQLFKNIRRAAKENNQNRGMGCINNNNALSFIAKFNKKSPYDQQFRAQMDAIVNALRQNGVAPAATCAVCGGAHPESLCFTGSFQPVHRGCMMNTAAAVKDEVESNNENGSYLLGFVGALLGMLVGLIPSLLTIAFMDRIYAILFALIPMAAMWGYKKFKGKMSRGAIVIIILLSFLGVFVMQYLTMCIYVMHEYEMGLSASFALASMAFFNGAGFAELVSSSLSHFVFMLLGVWIAWGYIGNQTNGTKMNAMNTLLGTMRPNPNLQQDDDPEGGV